MTPPDRRQPGSVPHLFRPLTLRGLTLRNRVVVSPMCQYLAVDGAMQDWHAAHHARFALGGVGAGMVEATGVTRDGRISPGCTGIYDDRHLPALQGVVRLYHDHGAAVGIQIGHSGRKGSTARPWEGAGPLEPGGAEPAWETMAPSAIPAREDWHTPRAMTEADIREVIAAFATAARRADRAGFDMVEIHGAHGYLIHSFFSPLANRRDDAWGGDRAGRMAFPLAVAKAVRAVWPERRPLFYRASVVDNAEGGIAVEDTIALAKALKDHGVDLIDCSSGGILGPVALSPLTPGPGFQVPLAEAVRSGAGLPTMAVGMITEPAQAEAILAEGRADLVAMAREFLADPNWTYRAAMALGLETPEAVLPEPYAFHLARRRIGQQS